MVEGFFKGRHVEIMKISICDQDVSGRENILEQILGNIRAPKIVVNGDCLFVSEDGNDCGFHFVT